jgi:hypothetical protein
VMMREECAEPAAEKMKNKEEVNDDKSGVDRQLDQKCAECLRRFPFHNASTVWHITASLFGMAPVARIMPAGQLSIARL